MPFIGRDWRSPGEAWVKTESLGWQRMKIIESQLHPGCHQYHGLACSSWPPPSQYGIHMANNCSHMQATNNGSTPTQECVKTNTAQTSSIGTSSKNNNNNSNDITSRSNRDASGSSSSSECNSDIGSVSSSPISSPERRNNTGYHLHPITISSPYGRHSCCGASARNNSTSPCGSPQYHGSAYFFDQQTRLNATTTANQMPRSLSKDILNDTSTKPVLTTDPSALNINAQTLKINRSCSDLRSSATDMQSSASVGATVCNHCDNLHRTMIDRNNRDRLTKNASEQLILTGSDENKPTNVIQTPMIMKNDRPYCDTTDCLSDTDDQTTNNPTNNTGDIKRGLTSPQLAMSCCCCNPASPMQMFSSSVALEEQMNKTVPHCRVSVRTREVAIYNTISEAFYRLDFYNAIHDIRRFNYICKLLHLLITQNLTSLSGCGTKVLFTMLEQVAWEVASNKRNIHVIRNLLDELKETISKYYCWGRPIGSSALWQQHFDTIDRISRIVDEIELSQASTDRNNQVTFDKLPVEMIREILLRLNDYRDLINSAQASFVMRHMIDEQYIWKKLCRYHFTEQQLKLVLADYSSYINRAKRNTLRGIKYARTASADGKMSYRNPVGHRRNCTRGSGGGKSSTTKNDIRDLTRHSKDGLQGSGATSSSSSDSDGSPSNATTTSHVIKTIRIFDREGSSTVLNRSTRQPNANRRGLSTMDIDHNQARSSNNQPGPNVAKQTREDESDLMNRRRASRQQSTDQNSDINWELVFHQLRKQFDLKEEYADCLLLCRHCRCLFWKSIGHPCIKSDNETSKTPRSLDRRASQDDNGRIRPSVASLSRSFDSRARSDGPENRPPSGRNRDDPPLIGRRSGDPFANRNHRNVAVHGAGAILRDLNGGPNANQQQQQQQQANLQQSRDELVPKHITITPQAFLKLFSL